MIAKALLASYLRLITRHVAGLPPAEAAQAMRRLTFADLLDETGAALTEAGFDPTLAARRMNKARLKLDRSADAQS